MVMRRIDYLFLAESVTALSLVLIDSPQAKVGLLIMAALFLLTALWAWWDDFLHPSPRPVHVGLFIVQALFALKAAIG